MREQKGITLVSLSIYVIVMIIVIAVMGIIITHFYENTNAIQQDTKDIVEFNKFNTYFLKEIKTIGNKVDTIGEEGTYILFKSGNSFAFNKNSIYYNDIEVCKDVYEVVFSFGITKDENGLDKIDNTIIDVHIVLKEYNKNIRYKVEEIY